MTALASIYVGCFVAMTVATIMWYRKDEKNVAEMIQQVKQLQGEKNTLEAKISSLQVHLNDLIEWKDNVANKSMLSCKEELDKCQEHLARMREELQAAKSQVQRHKVQVMIVEKPKAKRPIDDFKQKTKMLEKQIKEMGL